jgi:hypothetical protein
MQSVNFPGLDIFHVHVRCFDCGESPKGRPLTN